MIVFRDELKSQSAQVEFTEFLVKAANTTESTESEDRKNGPLRGQIREICDQINLL